MAKKQTQGETCLLPTKTRERVSRLTVHFDFDIRREHLSEFNGAWKLGGTRAREVWGPFSSRSETSLGLTVMPGTRQRRFHAVLEFRKGRTSPYPKVSDRTMAAFVDALRRLGSQIKVASWYETIETNKASQPEWVNNIRATTDNAGYATKMTGFEFLVEKEGEPSTGISLRWGGPTFSVTGSTKGHQFKSVAELFDPGARVLRIQPASFAGPGLEETGRHGQS